MKINEKTIKNILNNKEFADEASLLLQKIIDEELEKTDDEIDFNLIDECSNAIVEIKNSDNPELAKINPLFSSNEFLSRLKFSRKRSVRSVAKVFLIAAIILTSTISANAAVNNATGEGIVKNIIHTINKDEKKVKKSKNNDNNITSPKRKNNKSDVTEIPSEKTEEENITKEITSFYEDIDESDEDFMEDVEETTEEEITQVQEEEIETEAEVHSETREDTSPDLPEYESEVEDFEE